MPDPANTPEPNPGTFSRLYRRVMALRGLSGNAKVVHALLCDLAVFKEEAIGCGLAWIGDQCGITKPAVVEAVRELEAAGLLIVERTTGGRRCRNLYTPQVPLEDSDPAKRSARLTVWKRERARERMWKRSARPTPNGRNVLPQTVGTSYHQNGRNGGSVDNSLLKTNTETTPGQRPALPFFNSPEREGKEASTQIEAPPEPKGTVGGNGKANPPKQKHGRNRQPEEANPLGLLHDGQRLPTTGDGKRLLPFPPIWSQVAFFARREGIDTDFARAWFSEWTAADWKMRGGGPILDWGQSLRARWRYEAKRRSATA